MPPPVRSSSLFAADPPQRVDDGDDDATVPALAPLLQTVAVGGRLVDAEPSDPAPPGRFGAVLVTTTAGEDARLVTPGAPAAERVVPAPSAPPLPAAASAPAAPLPAAAPPPADPPPVATPPVLVSRSGGSGPGLPTRERREALRVLMVEDNPTDAALAQALFEAAGSDTVRFHVTADRQTGMDMALEFEPHVVLLDLDLPDSHGLATITRWCFSDLPGAVVVLSGEYSPVIEQQGREQGVSEFLPKAQLTEWLEQGEEGVAAAMELLESLAVRAPIT
jgi:CheY-like chemotaxis protein